MYQKPIFLICLILLASCAVTTKINTTESDSEIYVDGELVGKGQVKVQVKRNDTKHIEVKKEGFIPEETYLKNRI